MYSFSHFLQFLCMLSIPQLTPSVVGCLCFQHGLTLSGGVEFNPLQQVSVREGIPAKVSDMDQPSRLDLYTTLEGL